MRVISHTCSNTEIVCALNKADYLIAVDEHSDYPEDIVKNLVKTGPDLNQNIDLIKSLRPDLILTSLTVPGHEKIVEGFQKNNLPHLVIDPLNLADVANSIVTIADALGCLEEGLSLKHRFLDNFNNSKREVCGYQPKVLIQWWNKPVIGPCKSSWVNQLIEFAGGQNPWAKEDGKSRVISEEEIIQVNPDLIILAWCGINFKKIDPEVVYRNERLKDVAAVQNKNVHVISEEYLGRPGPRLLDGLKLLKRLI